MTSPNSKSDPRSTGRKPLLEARRISKRFPGVLALQNVNLTLEKGQVLAVIGENGAGKSTLMKILAGVQGPNDGQILVDGNPVNIDSVRKAERLGIALIHQELNLADNLDVGANIFLGREPRKFGLIDTGKINRDSEEILKEVQLNVSPREIVNRLSIGQQQMVEIAKALAVKARVLIMDEPTSSLSQHEADNLFRVIKGLRERGVSIVYISHRLGEVKELADRVLVLRDGENAGELAREEISHDRMVSMMVGRDLSQYYQRKSHPTGDVILDVSGLRTVAHPRHEVNLQVRAGELVGLSGLVGAGRTELLRVIFGVDPRLAGEIKVGGVTESLRNPVEAIRAGIGLVPENRKEEGLILEMVVRENISLASLRRDQFKSFLNKKKEEEIVTQMIQDLNVKTPSREQIAQYLSGGNQQKLVLGKWLALKPRLLLLDEPTRGIDIGAKQEIYGLMEKLAADGIAVLFVSSEMEEILHMSDRVLVMHEGKLTGELKRDQLSEEAVMQLATGGSKQAA